MKLHIDESFRNICRQIVDVYDRDGQRSLVWSDDLYQARNHCGGWDEEAKAFAFSYYAEDGNDYIFMMTLAEARHVAAGGDIDPTLEYWKRAPPLQDEGGRDAP